MTVHGKARKGLTALRVSKVYDADSGDRVSYQVVKIESASRDGSIVREFSVDGHSPEFPYEHDVFIVQLFPLSRTSDEYFTLKRLFDNVQMDRADSALAKALLT